MTKCDSDYCSELHDLTVQMPGEPIGVLQLKALLGPDGVYLPQGDGRYQIETNVARRGYSDLTSPGYVETDYAHAETLYEDDRFYFRENVLVIKREEDDDGPAYVMSAMRSAQLERDVEDFEGMVIMLDEAPGREAAIEEVRAHFLGAIEDASLRSLQYAVNDVTQLATSGLVKRHAREMLEHTSKMINALLLHMPAA